MLFGREKLFHDEEGGLYASTHDQEGDEAILIEPESLECDDLRRRIGRVKAASGMTRPHLRSRRRSRRKIRRQTRPARLP
jgi:hypothetical protein